MVVDPIPVAGSSWKDKFLNGRSPSSTTFLGSDILDNTNFEFVERDMQSNVNGTPTIDFSEQIQHLLVKDMATTVVKNLCPFAMAEFNIFTSKENENTPLTEKLNTAAVEAEKADAMMMV
ncbi:hypothetical protein Golax_000472 [Gossypium laxum]|uniref:Uncharacterized protein n=1 Tax=Gossypium laxum TaxID=34288 RepID=A0A7J9ATW5_9ROSI|nr:hypothetical protein [Gossypium laxum]